MLCIARERPLAYNPRCFTGRSERAISEGDPFHETRFQTVLAIFPSHRLTMIFCV